MREMFPTAEIAGYTVWQRFDRLWSRLLHRFGIHSDVWTYRVGVDTAGEFEEKPLVIGGPNHPTMVIVKQLECEICHRKEGPLYTVDAEAGDGRS